MKKGEEWKIRRGGEGHGGRGRGERRVRNEVCKNGEEYKTRRGGEGDGGKGRAESYE